MNEVKALSDVREAVEVCRACGFCDNYCAVFPAIERQRAFSGGDLRYLAYLCHNCRGCYYACQSAPEPIDINLPRNFAILRDESHAHNVWPQTLTPAFRRNGLIVSLTSVISIVGVLLAVFLFDGPSSLENTQLGANAFYRIVPWASMVGIAGVSMLFSVLALTISARKFWRESGGSAGIPGLGDILVALRHIATLKNLGGGRASLRRFGQNAVDCPQAIPPCYGLRFPVMFHGNVCSDSSCPFFWGAGAIPSAQRAGCFGYMWRLRNCDRYLGVDLAKSHR